MNYDEKMTLYHEKVTEYQKKARIYQEKITIYKEVVELVKEFAAEFAKEFFKGELECVEEVDIDKDNVEVSYQFKPHCGSCYSDYREFVVFPVEYLWNPNWKEMELEKREQKRARIEAKKKQEEVEKQKQDEQRRREVYATLRKEFDNV